MFFTFLHLITIVNQIAIVIQIGTGNTAQVIQTVVQSVF